MNTINQSVGLSTTNYNYHLVLLLIHSEALAAGLLLAAAAGDASGPSAGPASCGCSTAPGRRAP